MGSPIPPALELEPRQPFVVVVPELPAACNFWPLCTADLLDTSALTAEHRTAVCSRCRIRYVAQPTDGCHCYPGTCPARGGGG